MKSEALGLETDTSGEKETMKTRNLAILLVVAAAAVTSAIFSYRRDTSVRPGKPSEDQSWRGAKLLPRLVEKVGDIRRIEIDKAGAKIALVRDDQNNWKVETADGYPADPNRVRQLAFGLSELVASDRLTNDAAKYGDFGVGEEVGQEGTIRMTGASGEEIATLVLGKTRELNVEPGGEMPRAWGGQFVRVGGDPFVYLAGDRTYAETTLTGWANTEFVKVATDDVMSVEVDHATTESVRLAWDDGKLKLEGAVAKGKRANESKIKSVRSALDHLRFNNVVRADSKQGQAVDFTTTATFKTLSGSIYTMRVGEADETTTPTKENAAGKTKCFVAVGARYGEPFFTDDDTATTPSLAAAKEKAKKAQEAVPSFNESHAPWLFEIAQWNRDNIAPGRYELIEAEPTPTPAPAPKTKPASKGE
jgi:hypothetical protein